jgi:uncharacterized 2Fe-2S/4Fe-4S cluster protein (DUF4445 family)
MKNYSVTIMPENITVSVPQGTSLLTAANIAGISIESPCGGRGTCGKCAAKIISVNESEVETVNSSHLKQDLKETEYVLACQTKVDGNMVIEVPKFSRLTRHKVLLSSKNDRNVKESAYFKGSQLNPLCKKIHIALDKPDLNDSMNDLDRVKTCLSREYGFENINISLSALRDLSYIIREGNWEITLILVSLGEVWEIINIEPGEINSPAFGLAIDIGTTTVVVNLIDIEEGRIIDTIGTYNKQSIYGSDVISRIIYSDENPSGLELLQDSIIKTINELIDELLKKNHLKKDDISMIVCAGNTVMSHLFLKMPVTYIRLEPYIPGATQYPIVRAKDLNIIVNPDAPVIILPSVASYVGGDITAGVLANMITKSEKLTLFIDVGTNGELVLGNNEWMVTCS